MGNISQPLPSTTPNPTPHSSHPSRRPLPHQAPQHTPDQLKHLTSHPRECCQRKEEGHKSNDPKDTMMRQTKGRVAALTVAVFCVLGLIWIPHQASAQTWVGNPPNGDGKALSTRVRNPGNVDGKSLSVVVGNPGNAGGKKVGTAGSGSYLLNLLPPTSGAKDTFTDITNADAFVSSFRPYYRGYGGYSARCTAIGC